MQSSRSKTIILGRGEGRGDMIGLSERREGEGGEGNFEGELNDRRASGEILVGYYGPTHYSSRRGFYWEE